LHIALIQDSTEIHAITDYKRSKENSFIKQVSYPKSALKKHESSKVLAVLTKILKKWHWLIYWYHISPKVMIKKLAQKTIAPIYQHKIAYITLRKPIDFSLPNHKNLCTECTVLKTVEFFQKFENKKPDLFPVFENVSFSELKRGLSDYPDSIVILAVRPDSSGLQNKIIGYRWCQVGIFSAFGVKYNTSHDILYVLNTEVLPEYRGQRINQIMMEATHQYCRQNRLNKIVGVIETYNLPSLKQILRWKEAKIIGKFEMLSIFGGLYRRVTPWDKVKEYLENS
jgi:ribosomal protein S18 acetylase RimI-like enzyme